MLDDWDSSDNEIDAPPARPWSMAGLLCGSAALGLEVFGATILVFGFVLGFPLSMFALLGGDSPVTSGAETLTALTIIGASLLALLGITFSVVARVRRESLAMPIVAAVLSSLSLVVPLFVAVPWLGQVLDR